MAVLITCKLSPECLQMLRAVADKTGEKQYRLMSRLLTAEMKRLRIKLPKA